MVKHSLWFPLKLPYVIQLQFTIKALPDYAFEETELAKNCYNICQQSFDLRILTDGAVRYKVCCPRLDLFSKRNNYKIKSKQSRYDFPLPTVNEIILDLPSLCWIVMEVQQTLHISKWKGGSKKRTFSTLKGLTKITTNFQKTLHPKRWIHTIKPHLPTIPLSILG